MDYCRGRWSVLWKRQAWWSVQPSVVLVGCSQQNGKPMYRARTAGGVPALCLGEGSRVRWLLERALRWDGEDGEEGGGQWGRAQGWEEGERLSIRRTGMG